MTITEVRPPSETDVQVQTVSTPDKPGFPPSQFAIAIGITLLTLAYIPGWSSSVWVPKEAVLAILAAAGLPVLFVLGFARHQTVPASTRLAARFAMAFVVVGLVSALLSSTPGIALVGLYQQGTGWVFMCGAAGCYALATRLGPRARELLQVLIIFSAVINAVVAVIQLTGKLDNYGLPLYNGQLPDGLQANPFELGALLTGALALCAPRFIANPRKWYLPVAILMVGDGVCGERLPQLLVFAVIGYVAWRVAGPSRTRNMKEIKSAAGFAVLSIASLVLGYLIYSWSTSSGAFQRVTTSTSSETFGQRFEAWREGLRSFSHHWMIGSGPGQFRAATSSLFPFSFVKSAPGMVFTDAHNFVVEYLTTTGILGAAALIGLLVVAFCNARGPFVLACVVLLAVELAEPLNVAVFPVALAMLGAAGPLLRHPVASPPVEGQPVEGHAVEEPDHRVSPLPSFARLSVVVMVVVGIVAGALLVVGDGLMLRSEDQFGTDQTAALATGNVANTLLAAWPEPAQNVSKIHFFLGLGDHQPQRLQSIYWAKVAVSRDPTNPSLLVGLASYEMSAGEFAAAQHAAIDATHYLPWYPSALNVAGVASLALGEKAEAHHYFGLSLKAEPGQGAIENFYSGQCSLQLHQIGLSLLDRVCKKG
ncbi:MAG: O-antigen ligase family protein [Acidimicrobiales bacterium]